MVWISEIFEYSKRGMLTACKGAVRDFEATRRQVLAIWLLRDIHKGVQGRASNLFFGSSTSRYVKAWQLREFIEPLISPPRQVFSHWLIPISSTFPHFLLENFDTDNEWWQESNRVKQSCYFSHEAAFGFLTCLGFVRLKPDSERVFFGTTQHSQGRDSSWLSLVKINFCCTIWWWNML